MEHKHVLNQLQASRAWYHKEIAKETTESEQLKSNPATVEKYSREKYLMKRDNEDLYLVPEKHEVVNK
jgi:cell division protein FtsB